MIEYYNYTGYACESRYYYNFGYLIAAKVMGEGLESTPFFTLSFRNEFSTNQNAYVQALLNLNPNAENWPLPIYEESQTDNRDMLIKFLLEYIFPKYWDEFILPYGTEEDDFEKAYSSWFSRFISILFGTFPKYTKLISLFASQEANLLSQVKSKTVGISRFNDTPQEGGDFSDEDHTTTATKVENDNYSDFETPIKRLKEVRDNLEDCYNAWAFEFDKLFTMEVSEL